jgi:hypothetical protein
MCHMPHPSHLDFTTHAIFGKNTDHLASHYVIFTIPLSPLSLLGSSTLLNTLFSNTLRVPTHTLAKLELGPTLASDAL